MWLHPAEERAMRAIDALELASDRAGSMKVQLTF